MILGRSTVVESTCPATREAIRIELDSDAVTSIEPKDSAVSQRHHGELITDVRAQVCDRGHFLASPSAASAWATEHPDGEVLNVGDAFDHERTAYEELRWIPK